MNGMNNVFQKQIAFQKIILRKKGLDAIIPIDSKSWFVYHITAMVEELGELLKADKRWKTHRNTRYDREEKLDELADVFITAVNIAIYSGFDSEEVETAILKKIADNTKRVNLGE